MAKNPQTGVCYLILNITPDPEDGPVPPRILATIDQNTGVATSIGGANQTFATSGWHFIWYYRRWWRNT